MSKLKGLKSASALKRTLPPATVGRNTGRGPGTGLTIVVPDQTRKALKVAAAEQGTTVRALVLEALAAAGYEVPEGELGDRRR
jgi:hypothetical protein